MVAGTKRPFHKFELLIDKRERDQYFDYLYNRFWEISLVNKGTVCRKNKWFSIYFP